MCPDYSTYAAGGTLGDADQQDVDTLDDLAVFFGSDDENSFGSVDRQNSTSSIVSLGSDFFSFGSVDRQNSTSSIVSLGSDVFIDSFFDCRSVAPFYGSENVPPSAPPSSNVQHGLLASFSPPSVMDNAGLRGVVATQCKAPVLVQVSRAILIEEGPALWTPSAPMEPTFMADTTGTWNSKLKPEARRKHRGWAAKKKARVKYGRKFVYAQKAAVARKRRREDGKFETREMQVAQRMAAAQRTAAAGWIHE